MKPWSRTTAQTFFILSGLVAGTLLGGCSQSMESAAQDSASKSASAAGAPPGGEMRNAAVQPRAIIRKASETIRVPDVEKTERDVTDFVATLGGYVSESHSSNLNATSPSVTMVLRVPVQTFDSTLLRIEAMGTRMEKSISGEDVTAQLVDFDARLKIMQAQEESFRNILKNSSRTSDSLEVQSKLMNLRGEIESLEAQRKAMSGLATLSTIEATFVGSAMTGPKVEDKQWMQESWSGSVSVLSSMARSLGSLAIFLLVLSPFWLPFVVFLVWAVRKGSKRPDPQL
ncbi:MAG: DUF4349 domain-containing protein [Armatimonadetes bacterium]|nr:DUF4349 domain-containing protein [Armatimonadota bacterium]